jgi:hypothetical protein
VLAMSGMVPRGVPVEPGEEAVSVVYDLGG